MARQATRVQTGPSSSSVATTSTSTPVKLDKAGLYDLAQVKRTLDDEVISFLEASGYAAVTWTTDVKIVLGTIAVAAALYSHFNKQEYPDNKYIVLGCVMIYMVCVAITTCIGTFIEGNSVFMATPTKRAQKMGRLAKIPLIRTFSSFPKHGQSVYLLTFKKGKKIGGGKAEDNERAAKMSYEKYFTSEGEFLATKFRKDVAELLNSLGTAKKSQ